VPARFSEMKSAEPELAQACRQQTRALFTDCFARGYRAVDFFKDERAGGAYLLAKG
jgi:predicted GNAT superfamily acetyltransferase